MQIPVPQKTDAERQHLREHFLEPETRCDFLVDESRKKLWKCMLDILEQILVVCKRHDLKCFLMSGTLLGAVRHGGFVPWDDDLDICLPRQDYEKLRVFMQKELPPPLFVQTVATDRGYNAPFMKIRNSATAAITPTFVENHIVANLGIFVDIHALDGIPKTRRARKVMTAMTYALTGAAKYAAGVPEGNHGFARRALRFAVAKMLGRKGISRASSLLARQVPFGTTEICGLSTPFFGFGSPPHRGMWPTEWFSEAVETDFEYLRAPIPKHAEDILTKSYGNWHEFVRSGYSFHDGVRFDADRDYKSILIEEFGYKPDEFLPSYRRKPAPFKHKPPNPNAPKIHYEEDGQ